MIAPTDEKPAMPTKPVKEAAMPIANSDSAPFVYFDRVAGFGVNAGVVVLELGRRHHSLPSRERRRDKTRYDGAPSMQPKSGSGNA